MSSKTTFLFDIGNVVIESDHKLTHSLLVEYGIPRGRAELFFNNDDYIDFARGTVSGREFYEAVIEKPLGCQLTYEQVRKAHDAHLMRTDQGVVAILRKIPRRQLVIATNTNAWQTERERKLIDITEYSDHVFRSDEMRMLKKEDACFPYIAEKLGVKRKNIVLIDDSAGNTSKAEECGLQAIQFLNAEQLSEELRKSGLVNV